MMNIKEMLNTMIDDGKDWESPFAVILGAIDIGLLYVLMYLWLNK